MSGTEEQRAVYGLGKVYRRGVAWWIYWYDRGDRRESVAKVLGKPTREVTVRDAQRLLRQRIEARSQGRTVLPRHARATVGEMLTDYEKHLEVLKPDTVDGLRSQIRAVRVWLGDQVVTRLDLATLEGSVREREEAGWARGTIRTRLGLLHAAMAYWKRCRRLAVLPDMPFIKVENVRRGFFEREDFLALMKHLPEPAADIAWVGYCTGWRINEVLRLTWDQVDLQERVLRLDTSKTGEGRTRPIVERELLGIFERRRGARVLGLPAVFWRRIGKGRPVAVSETWFRVQWQIARVAAGLPEAIPHDFRRTAYRNLVLSGSDLVTAMELTGHKSLTVAKRYNIAELVRQRVALERLEAHRETLATRSRTS
jgi:integrase